MSKATASRGAHPDRRRHASGRPRQQQPRRMSGRLRQRRQPATRLHHQRLRQPMRRRFLAQRSQIAAGRRPQVGVDRRGRARSYSRYSAASSCDATTNTPSSRCAQRARPLAARAAGARRRAAGRSQPPPRRPAAARVPPAPPTARPVPAAPRPAPSARPPRPSARAAAPAAQRRAGTAAAASAAPAPADPRTRGWPRTRCAAPRRSSSALVATVVPCPRWPSASGASPACSSARSTPSITARDWSSTVVGSFTAVSRPSCTSATSVNVPPTSTPASVRIAQG